VTAVDSAALARELSVVLAKFDDLVEGAAHFAIDIFYNF
jgi:hypothetical protein